MNREASTSTDWASRLRGDPDGLQSGWLSASYDDPAGFYRGLIELSESRGGAFKSAYAERYDLYHDAIVRHLGSNRAALRHYRHQGGWQTLTYEQLHDRCSTLARAWVSRGVEPGAVVAVFLPMGADYLTALFTAWRLGAIVCPIPIYGRDYSITRRLTDAGPAAIATSADYHTQLEDFADILIPVRSDANPVGSESGSSRSHTYASGEACALLYSPLRTEHDAPVELTCDDAFLRALRDGALVYALNPGEALAAPGFAELQYQPALWTAILLAGGTCVEIAMRTLRAMPHRLMDFPLGSLGVTVEVRDLLLQNPPPRPPSWRQWFRNPEEVTDWTAWQDFVDANTIAKKPAMNVIVEAAAGGALLCSRVENGDERMRALMNVHPAPGVPWQLLDGNQSGQEAVSDFGIFAHGADEPVAAHVLYGRYRGADGIYMGNPEPRRDGWVYPSTEVVAAIADLPYVEAASVVEFPSGANYHYRFVLLVFTGYHGVVAAELASARREQIERAIAAAVGERFMPDRVRLFPLFAKMADGGADDDWCRLQFYRGSLHRKAESPLYSQLTALRQGVRDAAQTEGGE